MLQKTKKLNLNDVSREIEIEMLLKVIFSEVPTSICIQVLNFFWNTTFTYSSKNVIVGINQKTKKQKKKQCSTSKLINQSICTKIQSITT